jgi:hypothetical protein
MVDLRLLQSSTATPVLDPVHELRVARREHRCCECKGAIKKGEEYDHIMWGFSYQRCKVCAELLTEEYRSTSRFTPADWAWGRTQLSAPPSERPEFGKLFERINRRGTVAQMGRFLENMERRGRTPPGWMRKSLKAMCANAMNV